jgi:glycosyltransferase involved in cell wall biosynthesis
VIVTCRNSENNIDEALLSLKAQTIPPSYVIVVDDGSKDRTADKLRKLQSDWHSLHVITNPDLGYNIARVVSNWNKAIKYAKDHNLPTTDYHMISTDDTVYAQDYAEKVMRHMDDPNEKSKVAIASGNYEDKQTVAPHGAGRFVRNEFFDKYHCLYPEKMGYESLVLYSATRHGYTFQVFNDAKFEHTRPLGKNHHFYEFGASMRTLGYHPLFVLGRFLLYFASGKPTGRLGAIYMLYYYLSYKPKETGYDSMHDSGIRQYIRNYQFTRIKKKLGVAS